MKPGQLRCDVVALVVQDDAEDVDRGVRLIGNEVAGLVDEDAQLAHGWPLK